MKEKKFSIRNFFKREESPAFMMVLIIMVIVTAINPTFIGVENILDVLRTTSYSLMIAAALTCLMVCGEMDLCFGAVVSLAGVVCGYMLTTFGLPIPIAILIALLTGLAIGLLKTFLLCKIGLPGFITTLGIQYALNGLILLLTGGQSINFFPDAFKALGQKGPLPKLYWTIIVALIMTLAFHFILSRTRLGRSFYAIGGNRETARLSGININRVSMAAHVMVSVCAALVGVFKAARFNSAQPGAGSGTELLLMCGVIIGGTGIAGGKGTVLGTLLGCFLMAEIDNGLILTRVSSYWNNLIFGVILILALTLDLYRQKRIASVKSK